jgi:hypothetical protein
MLSLTDHEVVKVLFLAFTAEVDIQRARETGRLNSGKTKRGRFANLVQRRNRVVCETLKHMPKKVSCPGPAHIKEKMLLTFPYG